MIAGDYNGTLQNDSFLSILIYRESLNYLYILCFWNIAQHSTNLIDNSDNLLHFFTSHHVMEYSYIL